MVEHLKQVGTSHSSRDLLKILVKMGAKWPAQAGGSWSLPALLHLEELEHLVHTDLQCCCSVGGGVSGMAQRLSAVDGVGAKCEK